MNPSDPIRAARAEVERERVAPADTDTTGEQPGDVIDRYKLLQQIGEGGFGTVWMAEQSEPVRRKVALKIIKLGMNTKQVTTRFEAERQALALMDHPHIAKVYDGGATLTGRPYFVMELVHGIPITQYCDEARVGLDARLELFCQVCDAIQHAHQKGVIHRDVKPSNVLVTLHDGTPVPKVIDFGIAKATSAELTQKTLFTEFRQLVGTPEYMAPEQAALSGLDVDTRADVYSLGVLLYVLLTGTQPFDLETALANGYEEMLRTIREEEPARPSTRVSTLGKSGGRVAADRLTQTAKLSKELRGDLDWIVLKAMEKDRRRRYGTASGLRSDIERFLADEPVLACPPSPLYLLSKTIRRNKGAFTAGSIIFVLLVSGITALAVALGEKEEQRRLAVQNELAASAEKERALFELTRANEVKRLISAMLETIQPEIAQGADTFLLEGILDETAEHVASGGVTDELVEAELRHLIGSAYESIALPDKAEVHLTRALEVRTRELSGDDDATLRTRRALAKLRRRQGRIGEARELVEADLATRERTKGEEHPETLALRGDLALLLMDQGEWQVAEERFVELLELQRRVLGARHPETVGLQKNLALLYVEIARFDEAEVLIDECIEIWSELEGERYPQTLKARAFLANLYLTTGRLDEAERLCAATLELEREVFGEHAPQPLGSRMTLADIYLGQDRLEEAEAEYRSLVELYRLQGDQERMLAKVLNNMAHALIRLQRHEEAEAAQRESLELKREHYGDDHPTTLATMTNLALQILADGRSEDALELLEIAGPGMRKSMGLEHPWTRATLGALADVYDELGRTEEAAELRAELAGSG